jgi:molybdopterin-containing oxidoreductase family membrane subunit
MGWAVSLHVVTAFLLSGLGSRHFWNTAILAPRFLITTGASGPAMLTLIFYVLRRLTPLNVKDSVFEYLKAVMKVTMPLNFFLIGCEVFHEFYTGRLSSASAQYLYFGLHGHDQLTKIIWSAVAMNTVATIILLSNKTKILSPAHFIACGLTIFGIWIEKGMGLIFPGFTPTPLGEIVEYFPSLPEVAVNVGVLAVGMLLFTIMAKVTIGIQMGQLAMPGSQPAPAPPASTDEPPPLDPTPPALTPAA